MTECSSMLIMCVLTRKNLDQNVMYVHVCVSVLLNILHSL